MGKAIKILAVIGAAVGAGYAGVKIGEMQEDIKRLDGRVCVLESERWSLRGRVDALERSQGVR
jgi:hypothetical protein